MKIYALVASNDTGLKIIDVSDLYNPELVGSISTGGNAGGVSSIKIEVKIYALVASGDAGLKIIDVSDPYNPVLIDNINSGGYAMGVSSI